MLLPKEFVGYLAKQIVRQLSPLTLEAADPDIAAELIASIVLEELAVEDKLNEEVRELLSQYSEYMRREGVSYQEMFRKIKNTLIAQRNIVRASGRDSGDSMKLSRDKVTDISHKILEMARKSRLFRVKKPANDVRLEVVRIITEILQAEDRVDRAARQKIRSQKREIAEGTDEWSVLHKRYYAEEMRKLGIDVGAAV
jgi:hypothetical protein